MSRDKKYEPDDIERITIGEAQGGQAGPIEQTPDMVFEPVFAIERVCGGPHVGAIRSGVNPSENLQSLASAFYSTLQLFQGQQREMMLRAMMSAVAEALRNMPLEKASARIENFNNYVLNRTVKSPKPLAQC